MPADTSTPPRPLLLLFDDDPQIRQRLGDTREGCEILKAADGAAARQMLARRHIDLVLLDLHMPRLNGLEVLHTVPAGGTSSQTLAARRLGISRLALYRRIDKYAAKPGKA